MDETSKRKYVRPNGVRTWDEYVAERRAKAADPGTHSDYWTEERARNKSKPEDALCGLTFGGYTTEPGTDSPLPQPRAATVVPSRGGGYW